MITKWIGLGLSSYLLFEQTTIGLKQTQFEMATRSVDPSDVRIGFNLTFVTRFIDSFELRKHILPIVVKPDRPVLTPTLQAEAVVIHGVVSLAFRVVKRSVLVCRSKT